MARGSMHGYNHIKQQLPDSVLYSDETDPSNAMLVNYVSEDNGVDAAGRGSINQPFATISYAITNGVYDGHNVDIVIDTTVTSQSFSVPAGKRVHVSGIFGGPNTSTYIGTVTIEEGAVFHADNIGIAKIEQDVGVVTACDARIENGELTQVGTITEVDFQFYGTRIAGFTKALLIGNARSLAGYFYDQTSNQLVAFGGFDANSNLIKNVADPVSNQEAATKKYVDDEVSAVAGCLIYQGTWDASTNTPTLADGTGTLGDYYVVSTGGTQDLGSGSISFAAGDWVVYNGSIWEKADHTDQVSSVFTRTGAVTAQAGDYDASQVDNDSGVAGTFVSDALDTLDNSFVQSSQPEIYWVAGTNGDNTNGDGSINKPWKTVQHALDNTTGNVVIKFDRDISGESLTMPATRQISLQGASGPIGEVFGGTLGTITMNNSTILHIDNVFVTSIDCSSVTGTCTIYAEECWINVVDNVDNSNFFELFDTKLSTSAVTVLQSLNCVKGTAMDTNGVMYAFGHTNTLPYSYKVYHVSQDNGHDTYGDGSINSPFKTVQAAAAAGDVAGEQYMLIAIDVSVSSQTLDFTTLSNPRTVSVFSPTAVVDPGGTVQLSVKLDSFCGFFGNNIFVNFLDDGTAIGTYILLEDCYVGASALTSGNAIFDAYGTRMSTSAITNVKANTSSQLGYYMDNATKILTGFDGFDADNNNIINVADPVNAQDADTKAARDTAITTHSGVSDAHHSKYTDAEAQAAARPKAGIVATGDWDGGSPEKYVVTFNTAFSDNNYAVTITGEDARSWSIESKTSAGFTINSGSNQVPPGNTFWIATKVYDP